MLFQATYTRICRTNNNSLRSKLLEYIDFRTIKKVTKYHPRKDDWFQLILVLDGNLNRLQFLVACISPTPPSHLHSVPNCFKWIYCWTHIKHWKNIKRTGYLRLSDYNQNHLEHKVPAYFRGKYFSLKMEIIPAQFSKWSKLLP